MKRLLFLVALIAGVAMAHVQRHDAVYIDGKRCSFFSYPLNAYISTHYSEWPFRPTFHGPGDGGGYWGFWSIRDSLLYLDSLTINTWGRSYIINNMHFSVRVPLQVIVNNHVDANFQQLYIRNDGSLYAYFVDDVLDISCSDDLYTFHVKNGRVHLLKRVHGDMVQINDSLMSFYSKKNRFLKKMKESRQKMRIRPYRETSSPLTAYYYVLDNLREKQDDNGKDMYIVEIRRDSNFKYFEEVFDIKTIHSWQGFSRNNAPRNILYKFYVTPKRETPFREIVFEFVMDGQTHKFKDSPHDAVELFEKSYAAIRKNRLFKKWIQEKKSRMNYSDIYFKREEKVSVWNRIASVDDVWKDVKIPGIYVGSLTFNGIMGAQYNFLLSDNGDILVSWATPPKGEKLLNVADDTEEKRIRMKRCHEPVVDENQPAGPLFCDYVIIRHDGKIEYGPKER